ncbi:phosphotransferase [Actinomadura sp. WMMB 499]|uniref:protein kinase domain-containing protein n=1 Tax=Actinomadura sp. WMMB 499 TaxID=1219491 RepID=UPI0012443CBE|nr:phosphotransferase [Actinomadura sp. WMMB 499]QFG25257.1 hypothetical protein F7P10_33035 [Actinomadura sp. WMMB 499]
MIGEHIGPYRLLSALGRGAGAVHRATGPDGRDVAIRTLPEGAVPDVARMREVRSPHVVDVLDGAGAGDAGHAGGSGRPYVVTRLVPGRPLADVVAERGPLAGEALHRTALGLAKALAAIHRAGLAHGDLHPGTVLVVDDAPVVVDFGVAASADPADDVRAWATVVLFAAVDPDAVPGGLRPLLEAAAAADRDARPSAAELAEAVGRLEPPPAVPRPAPESLRAPPAEAAPPAPDAVPSPAVPPDAGPESVRRTDADAHRLAVAQGWARLLAAMVVVIAVGAAMMMPIAGLALSLLAVTWLRAVTAVSFRDWTLAFGRTLATVPYAAVLTVAVPPALLAATVFGVEIDSLAACAFGAGAGAAVLWTAPGVRGPRRRLERIFLRVAASPRRIAAFGAVLTALTLAAVVGALSLTPSFAPMYGLASSVEAALDRLHGAFDRF